MKHFIACKTCGKRVTKLVTKVDWSDSGGSSEESLLLTGMFCIDPDENFYISISDKHDLKNHPEYNRWIGCCGPSSYGLPNLLCVCKSEIGREVSDCNTPHFIRFNITAVDLKADQNGELERILCLEVSEEEKASLEILWQYGQHT